MSGDRFAYLFGRGPDDKTVADRLIAELDKALGGPTRQMLPAGTIIFEEGQEVDGIWLLLNGEVRLFRSIDGEDVTFYQHTVGPIIGLLALARNSQRAAYSCRAIDDITFLHITDLDLDRALHGSPQLADDLTQVLLSALGERQRRAADQRVEIKQLNRQLETERDDLATALERLQRAQLRLVESEKMAALGELAAGVAHDLNNPATAIRRSADFLIEDLVELATADNPNAVNVLYAALTAEPLSTRAAREFRNELTSALGDERLAKRLIAVGITDRQTFQTEFPDPEQFEPLLKERELFHRIGVSLRSIDTAAGRIAALVASLRSHARPGRQLSAGIQVNTTIEDSLLLLGHETRSVNVERSFGDLPPIDAYPSELGQAWTNLISNAVEAMGGTGTLTITTDTPDVGHVRIRFTDDGPGIAPETLDHIFDINYTTKQGRVEFGLGLGLTITQQIVARHEGLLEVESRPGQTTFMVTLPIHQTTTGAQT